MSSGKGGEKIEGYNGFFVPGSLGILVHYDEVSSSPSSIRSSEKIRSIHVFNAVPYEHFATLHKRLYHRNPMRRAVE